MKQQKPEIEIAGETELTSPHTAKPRRPLSPHSTMVKMQQMPKKIPAPAGGRLILATQHPKPQAQMGSCHYKGERNEPFSQIPSITHVYMPSDVTCKSAEKVVHRGMSALMRQAGRAHPCPP